MGKTSWLFKIRKQTCSTSNMISSSLVNDPGFVSGNSSDESIYLWTKVAVEGDAIDWDCRDTRDSTCSSWGIYTTLALKRYWSMLVFLKIDLMSCSFTLKISTVWYDFHHDNTYICEDLVLSHDLLPLAYNLYHHQGNLYHSSLRWEKHVNH